MDFFWKIFDVSDFPARWNCGNWGSVEGYTFIISELFIWVAYCIIPIILLVSYWGHRKDKTNNKALILFAAFIATCGIGHLLDVVMFFWPAYRLLAVWHSLTAVISIVTAAVLLPIVSEVLNKFDKLQKLEEMQKINKAIREKLKKYENQI